MLLVAMAVVFLGCQATESEQPAESEMAQDTAAQSEPAPAGPDAVAVDPDHYTVIEENDQVRVLRISYPAGASSVMHHHPDGVAVFLTEHHAEFELPDGSKVEASADAGETLWNPAGQHLPTNVAEAPLELILVELKDAPDAAPTDGEGEVGPDPTVVDSKHYSVDFENDRVRVIRIKYGPGESSVMHGHPNSVAVFLDGLDGQFESPDGSTQEVTAEAGQAMYMPAGQHRPTNMGDEAFELVQIELK